MIVNHLEPKCFSPINAITIPRRGISRRWHLPKVRKSSEDKRVCTCGTGTCVKLIRAVVALRLLLLLLLLGLRHGRERSSSFGKAERSEA